VRAEAADTIADNKGGGSRPTTRNRRCDPQNGRWLARLAPPHVATVAANGLTGDGGARYPGLRSPWSVWARPPRAAVVAVAAATPDSGGTRRPKCAWARPAPAPLPPIAVAAATVAATATAETPDLCRVRPHGRRLHLPACPAWPPAQQSLAAAMTPDADAPDSSSGHGATKARGGAPLSPPWALLSTRHAKEVRAAAPPDNADGGGQGFRQIRAPARPRPPQTRNHAALLAAAPPDSTNGGRHSLCWHRILTPPRPPHDAQTGGSRSSCGARQHK